MIMIFTGLTRWRSMRFSGVSTGPRCFFRSTPLPSFPRGEKSTLPMHLTLGHLMRKTQRALRYCFSMMLYCSRKYCKIVFLLWCGQTKFLKILKQILSFSKPHNIFFHLLSKRLWKVSFLWVQIFVFCLHIRSTLFFPIW